MEHVPKVQKMNWIRPDPRAEYEEITRTLKQFLNLDPSPENVSRALASYEAGKIVELSNSDWEALENTDSFSEIRPGRVDDVEHLIAGSNSDLPDHLKRSVPRLLDAFQGGSIDAPIIMRNSEGRLHLVSGNTRLMLARALGIQPYVLMVDWSKTGS